MSQRNYDDKVNSSINKFFSDSEDIDVKNKTIEDQIREKEEDELVEKVFERYEEASLEAEAEEIEGKLAQVEEKTQEALSQCEEEASKAKAETEKAQEALLQYKKDTSNVRIEAEETKEKLAQVEKEAKEAQAETEKAKGALLQYKKDTSNVRIEAEEAKEKLAQVEEEVREAQAETEKVQEDLLQYKRGAENAKIEVEKIKEKLAQVEEEARVETEKAQEALSQCEQDASNARVETEEIKEKLAQVEEEARVETEKAQEVLSQCEQNTESTKIKIEQLNTEIKGLKEKIKKCAKNKEDSTEKDDEIGEPITFQDIKIKNPCIEEFIPLTLERGAIMEYPDSKDKYKIYDKSIDDNAAFFTAIIKLGDKEIGEFQTRYVAHCGSCAKGEDFGYIINFSNPMKSFGSNKFSEWEYYYNPNNKHNKFLILGRESDGYVFKLCNQDGSGITKDMKSIFPSSLVHFNKDYIEDLLDLEKHVGSIFLMSKSKLHAHFSNREDYPHAHPVEIREFIVNSDKIANPGRLLGTLNHEYGVFRESVDGNKREFIFDNVITKGKDVRITARDRDIDSKDENEPQKAFLFLAKYKSDGPCRNHSHDNNYSELKMEEYVLGFANNRGCIKIISNTHLNRDIDFKSLFEENQEKVITVEPRTPDMYDLWDGIQCVANPIHADSMFL